uniref:NADH dehydrogenase [ubiquinone] 1 alpha subcomplex subunit 11 n=1 Tax=Peromyscus maniculatus bairdii TaxID=230844 RepID=A0A8C8W860_PERMB
MQTDKHRSQCFFDHNHQISNSTHCHHKTYITTALGGLMSNRLSLQRLLNPADSHLEARAWPGRYTCTAAAVGAMFGIKPDDPLNYFIGGCAGGLILGAYAHRYGTVTVGCIYMGTTATLFKIGKLEGWEFSATPKSVSRSLVANKHCVSLCPQKEKKKKKSFEACPGGLPWCQGERTALPSYYGKQMYGVVWKRDRGRMIHMSCGERQN